MPLAFCIFHKEQNHMVKRILQYFRRETVLSAALVCALLSFLLTPPSDIHLQGIDTTTLLMLFSLMTIVAGFRRMGALDAVSRKLTRCVTTLRGLSAVMVALCFVLSMLVTNDVALLTLVPLTLLLFRAGGQKSTIWTVVLETVAANLGSMVTPIGNPQNLYLYTSGRLTALDFLTLLAPYAAVALALLLALCLLLPKERVAVDTSARAPLARKMLTLYGALSALALLAAFGAGVLGSLIYAILTVSFKANQNVTGLTLTIFGTGIANLFGSNYTTSGALGEGVMSVFKSVSIPGLSNLPYVGKLLFSYNSFVYFGVVLCIVLGIYINHTSQGRSLRAVGENPAAADAMGVNVTLYKYVHILLGGGICALGGAYVIIVTCNGLWTYNCINGLGWIAVALVIFSTWNPAKAIFGAYLFGAFRGMGYKLQNTVISLLGMKITFSSQLLDMVPYVATIVVLVIITMRKKKENQPPAWLSRSYFREER